MKPLGMDCAEALELILDRELLSERERLPAGETGTALDERWLAPDRRLAFEAHLRTCASCTAQSKGLDRALAALRAGSAAGLAVANAGSHDALDLWPGLRATLAAEGRFVAPGEALPTSTLGASPTSEPLPSLQRARWRWTRVASFASAAAVLALALPLLWKQDGRPSAGPNPPSTGTSAPVALDASPSKAQGVALEPSNMASTPELAPQLAAEVPAPDETSGGSTEPASKHGLRRALGEQRQREFATPFDASGDGGGWSLASDRELR